MKLKYNHIVLFSIAFILASCYTSVPYNSSLGESANSKYDANAEASSNGKYTYYDFQNNVSSKEFNEPIIEEDTNKKYTIKERTIYDTVFSSRKSIVQNNISEKSKDSILYALIKDTSLTDAEREQRIESFVKGGINEEIVFDTVITSSIIYDTVVSEFTTPPSMSEEKTDHKTETELNSEISRLKDELQQMQIKELQTKVDELLELQKESEEKQNKEVMPSESELYNMGFLEARKYFRASKHFWSVMLPSIIALLTGNLIPYLSTAALISAISAFIYNLASEPNINWNMVRSKFKGEQSFRNGYSYGAKRKIKKNVWLAMIPLFTTFLIIIFVLLWIFYIGL